MVLHLVSVPMISIQLNSFVHRIANKEQFISLAMASGLQLKRIRRSRHWSLSGPEELLTAFGLTLKEPDQWVKTAIDKGLPAIEPEETSFDDLVQMLSAQPNMTLTQLMEASGCSMVEARLAMDKFENLDDL